MVVLMAGFQCVSAFRHGQRDGISSCNARRKPQASRAARDSSARTGRNEAQRAPLLRPVRRQVDQPLEAEAARQATLHRGFDERRIEKGERERLADGALGPALAVRARRDQKVRLVLETIEPEPRLSIGACEGPSSLDAHRAETGMDALALDDLATPSGRLRSPRDGDRLRAVRRQVAEPDGEPRLAKS